MPGQRWLNHRTLICKCSQLVKRPVLFSMSMAVANRLQRLLTISIYSIPSITTFVSVTSCSRPKRVRRQPSHHRCRRLWSTGHPIGGNLDQRTRTFIPSNLRTTSMLWRFFAKDSNLPRTGKTVAHVASAYLQQDCWTLPRPLAGRNWRNRSGKAAHSSMFARLLLFGLAFLVKRKS